MSGRKLKSSTAGIRCLVAACDGNIVNDGLVARSFTSRFLPVWFSRSQLGCWTPPFAQASNRATHGFQ